MITKGQKQIGRYYAQAGKQMVRNIEDGYAALD